MNILMLSDFSTNARHAHQYALELYKNQDVTAFLHHVKKPCVSTKNCSGKCKLGLFQKLTKQAQELVSNTNYNTPEVVLTEGSFLEEVRSAVVKFNIDVIVIGGKGKSTNSQNAIGCHTKAIATKVKCPVLIVFEDTPLTQPKSVLFPVNYTDALYPVCLNKLRSLPDWENLSFKVVELQARSTAAHLTLSSKQILERSLKNFKLEFLDLVQEKAELLNLANNYNLMVYAAKNLSVGNQIFSELNNNKGALKLKTPLFVLHA